jgi:hypothetical protein
MRETCAVRPIITETRAAMKTLPERGGVIFESEN